MNSTLENLTIGTFADAAELETIRFYQHKRLLPTPERPYGRIRQHGAADVERVNFVKSAQRPGSGNFGSRVTGRADRQHQFALAGKVCKKVG